MPPFSYEYQFPDIPKPWSRSGMKIASFIYASSALPAVSRRREAGQQEAKEKEDDVAVKIFVALGALWSLGFFVYHFIRLLLGRRVF